MVIQRFLCLSMGNRLVCMHMSSIRTVGYIYKSCIPYAGCATLYVYKDKSVIRYSGLYDAGYFSEARLIPAQNKIRPDW